MTARDMVDQPLPWRGRSFGSISSDVAVLTILFSRLWMCNDVRQLKI